MSNALLDIKFYHRAEPLSNLLTTARLSDLPHPPAISSCIQDSEYTLNDAYTMFRLSAMPQHPLPMNSSKGGRKQLPGFHFNSV